MSAWNADLRLIRSVWKNNASQKLGPIDTKERQKMEYRQKLKAKWAAEKNVRAVAQYVEVQGVWQSLT